MVWRMTLAGRLAGALLAALIVVDGDTLRLGGERVRVIGLDAPEVRGACAAERRGAAAATAGLRAPLAGAEVTLARRGTDRYGRTLAVVRADGRDVAGAMIAAGLARPYAGGRRESWC